MHPADWVFSQNAYGRPEIDAMRTGIRDLFFNVSHTTGLIVLAVATGRAVGVDVENTQRDKDLLDVTKQVLSPEELQDLVKVPGELKVERFLQYWTLKEAYIKARGKGVSIPLEKLGFRFDQSGTIDLEIAPELADAPCRWQCWQFRPEDGYLIALCAERIEHIPTGIVARRMTSSGVDEIIPVQVDRVSA